MSQGNIVEVWGILFSTTRRRQEQKTWFSISPLLCQFTDNDKWKITGIGIYGIRKGILINWWKWTKQYKERYGK